MSLRRPAIAVTMLLALCAGAAAARAEDKPEDKSRDSKSRDSKSNDSSADDSAPPWMITSKFPRSANVLPTYPPAAVIASTVSP